MPALSILVPAWVYHNGRYIRTPLYKLENPTGLSPYPCSALKGEVGCNLVEEVQNCRTLERGLSLALCDKVLAVHPVLANWGLFPKCTATQKKPRFGVAWQGSMGYT